jgi:hypothetical protein
MTRKTKKTLMWVGGGALLALAVGGVAYAAAKPKATPAQIVAGTPVTTLLPGQKYAFAALLPVGITDEVALTKALTAAGWTGVTITAMNGAGSSTGVVTPVGGYAATAVWNGNASPVPTGVVAVTAL